MKIISAYNAAQIIKDNQTLAISGSGVCNVVPEKLLESLEERYKENKKPQNITVFHPQGIGDKKTTGVGRLAHKGLARRVIGGHWGMSPLMGQAANSEEIEAYNYPQGVLGQLVRNMVSKGPGVITKIGLNTFIDPRLEGGKMNKSAKDDLVEIIKIDNEEWLRYKPIPIDVAFIRGTTADEDGYISYEEEVHFDEVLALAAATKNNGGIVIVQAKYLAKRNSLDCHKTKIPGYLVDYVVIDEEQKQSYEHFYNPSYCGNLNTPIKLKWPEDGINVRKFIARRQALEIKAGMIVNVGVGISNGVPFILDEEGLIDKITLSIEQGQSGGIPVMGLDAGTMISPRVILDHPVQHDMYHGGVLDVTCLSAAEIDFRGNVNVSKMGNNIPGCGGFIDISQETKNIVFGGTFTAKCKISVKDNKVVIEKEGSIKKFVNKVQQVSFSGEYAIKNGKNVIFITERGVFKLTKEGLMLIEIAPGIDIEKDIIQQMEFKPLVSQNLKTMPDILFKNGIMGLKEIWENKEA